MSGAVHVFAGPSLPPWRRPPAADLVFHGPAAQGDVYALVGQRPLAIGIIDGYFERVPAVWHKEILWAMSEGVHVFGAASMGALRAAELAAFGMIGVGQIYEDFAAGLLTDDDEVTIVHADAGHEHRPLSEAMVNIRATVAAAERQGILSPGDAVALIAAAKGLFYPDRSFPALLEAARRDLPSEAAARFAHWLGDPANRVDQKGLDALALVQALSDFRSGVVKAKTVTWSFHHTDAWELVRRRSLQRRSQTTQAVPDGVRLRALEIELAKRDGFKPTDADLQLAIREYCQAKGLPSGEGLAASLAADGISWSDFERLIHEQACVRWARLVWASDLG